MKFTRKPMLEFFEKNNIKNLGAAYKIIKQNDSLKYEEFLKMVLNLNQKSKKSIHRDDNSPQLLYTSINPFNEQFDDYFYYEVTEEINLQKKKGKTLSIKNSKPSWRDAYIQL